MARALLIVNPRAGRGHPHAASVAEVLERRFELETIPSHSPEDIRRQARNAAERGAAVVFSLGGDGTARQAAAGVMGSNTGLGILPGGTGNVIAHNLDLESRPERAAQQLLEGHVIDVDVGMAGGQAFLMQASGGLDGEAMESVDPDLKRRLGMVAYATAAVRGWWQYDYPDITIEAGGERRKVAFFAACNIPYYGRGLRLAPHAGFQSGWLELVTLTRTGRWPALEFAAALVTRRHTELEGVQVQEIDRMVVHGPDDLRMQLDGDLLETRYPVDISLMPRSLRLLVPGAGESAP